MLDAQAVQKGEGHGNAWNARTFAQQTFVKWNEEIDQPLGHSGDPYVNNPLRIPRLDASQRFKAKDKSGFDSLVEILELVNNSQTEESVYSKLVGVLLGLRRWLADKKIDYPLPLRVSMDVAEGAIQDFLSTKSGGARLQAVVAAIFDMLSFAGFQIGDVNSGNINAPDSGSKSAGDVEFKGLGGGFAIEVKDRPLTRADALSSIEKARLSQVTDLMFIIRSDEQLASDLPSSDFTAFAINQFSSGLNLYTERFEDFLRVTMSLVGEPGRKRMLVAIGEALNLQGADISHKWAWAAIAKAL